MAYERNDRRNGGTFDRGYNGDADRGRATSYDYGSRDYRGGRQDERPAGNDRDDRGLFDRAGDEVRSWFGDEDAERRRREDECYQERDTRGDNRSQSDRGARDQARGFSSYASGGNGGDYGRGGYDQQARGDRDQHRDTYQSWRDRQVQSFDRDYDEYRREHQSKFDTEFHSWRQGRQGQRDLLQKVQEHQEVVGSDGQHLGTVDHVRGDRIKLTKQDQAAGGHHHSIPSSWIQSVDDKVTLGKTAEQAKAHWRDEERNGGDKVAGRDDRDTNLNRSFSGTY